MEIFLRDFETRFAENTASYTKVTAYKQPASPSRGSRKDRKPRLITGEIQVN
ncbi:MAG TPA: hypothetical protein VGD90_11290 [Sphingobacteriaceae bacterium]